MSHRQPSREKESGVMVHTGSRSEAAPTHDAEDRARELPSEFIEWQMEARRTMFSLVSKGQRPTQFGAHLPVAVTMNRERAFPVHSAAKGTGFLPRDEYLDEYIARVGQCIADCEGRPWKESLGERVAVIRSFYDHRDHIDFRRLGLLEIFQGQTYRNLQTDPRLTLHYTGDGPAYPSFQVNTVVEIVDPEDKRFQFIYLVRQLFEHDHFHIHQPDYPTAYVAWVQEVYDKSPFHGRAGRRLGASRDPIPSVRLEEILIPLDNSPSAEDCMTIGLQLARSFGATVTGSHVYAAKLHDNRFKQMEAGLPLRYQEPRELARQRHIHDSLITSGLEMISDSYLDVLSKRCQEADIPFVGKRPEGKNYAALLADINQSDYDLVVMGACGLGGLGQGSHMESFNGSSAILGSVTERVARRAQTDLLIIKNDTPIGDRIVVAVDGSPQSFAGVRLAVALAGATGADVEAVAAYDPHFHTVAFRGLEGVLSEEAGRVFRFQEQEKLHDEIINEGIAQIYADHLATAQRVAADDGTEIETTLLEGKPYPAILAHLEATKPSLLVAGRLGVHADEGLDLGATAENLLRLAACHVLLVAATFDPPTGEEILEAPSEGMPWTAEALQHLENVPPFARSFARKAIDDYAGGQGCEEVTLAVMTEAREKLGM